MGSSNDEWIATLVSSIAEGIAHNTINNDAYLATQTLKTIAQKNNAISFMYVTNFDDRVFAHTFDSGFPKALHHVHADNPSGLHKYTRNIRYQGELIKEVSYPIIKSLSASLYIGVNEAYTNKAIFDTISLMTVIFLAIGSAGIAIAFPISRNVTRPLDNISRQMENYARSPDFSPDLDAKNNSIETLKLQASFFQMIEDRNKLELEKDKDRQYLHLLLESTGVGIYGIDIDGNCSFVNRACLDMLGYAHENDLLNKNMHALIHHSHNDDSAYPVDECPVCNALDTGKTIEIEDEVFWRKDGSSFPVHYRSHPILMDGKSIGAVISFSDVSATQEAVRALARSEKKFQTLARVSPVGIFHTDAEGHCTYVNNYWCRLTGLKEHEALSDGWLNALHPEDINKVHKEWNASVAENRNFKLEYRFLHPNGHEVWVLGQSKAERDENENIVGFVGSITDITERKRSELALQKSEHDIHTILDNMVDTFYQANSQGQIIMVSQSIKDLLGYDASETLGKYLGDFYANPESREQFLKYLEEHNGHAINYEVVLRHKDGRDIWVSTNAHYRYDDSGHVIGIEGVAHDITESKASEQTMRDINKELEKRVDEQTREYQEARDIAEQASQTKSEFLSRMSHELRTPMNAILGFGQLLQSDEDNNLSEENMDFLNEILNAGNHLLELINEVLDLSRVESGIVSLSIDTLPPAAVITECISLITPIADKHGIKLVNRCEGIQDVRIRTDRTRLKQILINLMTNAVKYNTEKGSVKLSCEYMDTGRMRISVSDTGPGIPEDQQERMFKPFERLDDRSEVEGTGIGLAVTKRLVEMMDGTIGVDSSPGRGSTFWIELDARRITAPKSAGDTAPIANKPYQLLLVEDVPAKIKLISQILAKRTDIELLTARTAESGLDTASKLCPDAILLNHDMSTQHEFHLLEKLISTKHTQNIPLMAMSADANEPQQVQKILDEGVKIVFSDPLDITIFLEKLEQILPRKNKQQGTESVKNIQG